MSSDQNALQDLEMSRNISQNIRLVQATMEDSLVRIESISQSLKRVRDVDGEQDKSEEKALKTHEPLEFQSGVYLVVDGSKNYSPYCNRPVTLLNDVEQVDLIAEPELLMREAHHKRVSPNIVLTRLLKCGGKVVGVTTPRHQIDRYTYMHVWTVVIV